MSNWHVREGLQTLLARCLIETSENESDIFTLLPAKTLEEIV